MRNFLIKAGVALAGFSALAGTAIAASSDLYDYTYGYTTAADVAGLGGILAGLGIFGVILPICCGLVIFVLAIFNIWMFVDVLNKTEAQLPNRTMWIVLLAVGFFMAGLGGIAGLVYFFGPRKKINSGKK